MGEATTQKKIEPSVSLVTEICFNVVERTYFSLNE